MTTMVEKVARALWADYWDGDAMAWEEIDDSARQTSLSMARAAIEAILDVPEEVTAALKERGRT